MSESVLYDVAVVGGGPAGLTAAIFAARRGANVILIDRKIDPGQKLLLSGGGRCNILPSVSDPDAYVTDSSPFTLRNILRSWPLEDVRFFLEVEAKIKVQADPASGKLHVIGGGKVARSSLLDLAERTGVKIKRNFQVVRLNGSNPFFLTCPEKRTIRATRVILACGGLSYPQTGSDGSGLELLRSRDIQIVPPYPALTSLIGARSTHRILSGITMTVTVTAKSETDEASCRDGFLFTHRGYSGPAILNTSHVVARARQRREQAQVFVAWTDHTEDEWRAMLTEGKRSVRGVLLREMPDRVADQLLSEISLDEGRVATLEKDRREQLVRLLTRYPLPITRNDGFSSAEVTGGGVHLSEIEPKTMQTKKVPNLYICGEMLDAFGPIGGTNFLWAFVTGNRAGEAAGMKSG
ncbi:aminoacetone oxidase family FAD-binding enzyme [Candidatus Bipolaricaulota bacterium]|nr:aminoacetone oxidase family FAD-binding enzyme [Candidatus Bipolaricaulota bacterium]